MEDNKVLSAENLELALSENNKKIKEYVLDKTNRIDIAQKTVNTELDYCYLQIQYSQDITLSVDYVLPFLKSNGNMEVNESINSVILKAGKTYKISCDIYTIESGFTFFDIFDITNNKVIGHFVKSASNYNTTASNTNCELIYTSENDCEIQIKVQHIGGNQKLTKDQNKHYLIVEEINRQIVVDPVEYVNTKQGIEDTPVGHIIAHMGNSAPKHYLICDGTEYNITDYPHLAQHILDQFGTMNYFGGDGENTFAVPDLRGEFLRGTGTGIRNSGSGGEVGEHQDGTSHPYVWSGSSIGYGKSNLSPSNMDLENSINTKHLIANATAASERQQVISYTARPTNTSVLYCIKYEPTYYMNIFGLREKTVLWEGLSTNSNTITLSDDINNYDEIYIECGCNCVNQDFIIFINGQESYTRKIIDRSSSSNYTLTTITIGKDIVTASTSKAGGSSWSFYIYQVVGIKYHNTTEGSAISESYTDEEVNAAIDEILKDEEPIEEEVNTVTEDEELNKEEIIEE